GGIDHDLDDLLVAGEETDLPEPGRPVPAGGRGEIRMVLRRRDRLRIALGDLDRPRLRDGLRLRTGHGRHQQGCDQRESGSEEERTAQANVHSLLPTKLNGIARATAIAWEGMSAMPPRTSSSSAIRLIPRARTLTVK